MNTSEFAYKIGVSPKTIRRWIQYFELPFNKNGNGHYLFTHEDEELFRHIHKQLNSGVVMKDVQLTKVRKGVLSNTKTQPNEKHKSPITYLQKSDLQQLIDQVKSIEQSLDKKADEVVSYQLLQHRKEIDMLQKNVITLEKKIEEIEDKYAQILTQQKSIEPVTQKKKTFISTIFS
ncbi:MerR family transcriptional regulator [Cytobacillus sp. IB215665]|uniref:MerR family transcriptional regulator n=1 Tax=Cytobacillus sp. IB215665 TaxID=3097357 RepID=UPI002A15C444|nr:MerR family transcriptional regulator [Cytobacillus sp. IB215665]MDX8366413.1 MerR family transcriptional regulator [Cytobacillus sp. IB215665]